MFPTFPNNSYTGVTMPQYQNPYQARLDAMQAPQMAQIPQIPQRHEIIHVNGENGARAFRMAPNSQCLLLDDTAPIIWLAVTDGAGYPQLTPYTISPFQPQNPQAEIEQRLGRLEALIYGKPDATATQQTAQQPAGGPTAAEQPMGNVTAVPTVPTADGRP